MLVAIIVWKNEMQVKKLQSARDIKKLSCDRLYVKSGILILPNNLYFYYVEHCHESAQSHE